MNATNSWPDQSTLIPELLRSLPQARRVLDRYGLKGCGGDEGPVETLGFFARAHDVPLPELLQEIRREPPPTQQLPVIETRDPADAIYRPFFKAGIGVMLSLGAAWGAYLLARIAISGSFTAASVQHVNAHGHAQIFGWVGLFVMGFAYQAFPRFKHASLACPRLALATLWMLLLGLVGRSIGQLLAADHSLAGWIAAGASCLETAAIAAFVGIIAVTWRRSGKPLLFYDYYIVSALVWFVVQAVYEGVYLTVTATANGERLFSLVSTWQAPLRDLQIHGFAMLMIFGVSQRVFHHFYGLPGVNERLSLIGLALLNTAIAGEVGGLMLMRTAGHAWAALWYASVLLLTGVSAALVRSWRIFAHADDADRSLKFLRAAYGWLFVSLTMLVLLPFYQYGLLTAVAPDSAAAQQGFSHAYYGAARHAITVGFVSLMIVGVAAKVVPTLNGVAANRLPGLWLPFVLINTGCTLRVVGQTLTDFTPRAFALAGVSGLLEVSGLAIWGAHLWRVMSPRTKAGAAAEPDAGSTIPNGPIEAGYTVAAVLDRYPQLLDAFLEHGFTMLANPQLRRSIARVVTIERACRRMDVDCRRFVETLNRRLGLSVPQATSGSESYLKRTVKEWTAHRPQLYRYFISHGIDVYWDGDKPLAEACQEKGLDSRQIADELAAVLRPMYREAGGDWHQATMTELCDHIESTHHDYLRRELPRLGQLVNQVAHEKRGEQPELEELKTQFERFRRRLSDHVETERTAVFPELRRLENRKTPEQDRCADPSDLIRQMKEDHDLVEAELSEIRRLTNGYVAPASASMVYRTLLGGLWELEATLHLNMHEEDDILFSKALLH